jgi:hypothetical protein
MTPIEHGIDDSERDIVVSNRPAPGSVPVNKTRSMAFDALLNVANGRLRDVTITNLVSDSEDEAEADPVVDEDPVAHDPINVDEEVSVPLLPHSYRLRLMTRWLQSFRFFQTLTRLYVSLCVY